MKTLHCVLLKADRSSSHPDQLNQSVGYSLLRSIDYTVTLQACCVTLPGVTHLYWTGGNGESRGGHALVRSQSPHLRVHETKQSN